MKVAIKLMEMSSDEGYKPSSGYKKAILAPAAEVAACADSQTCLWEIKGRAIRKEELEDLQVKDVRRGVCNYIFFTGTLDVPAGMVVVQKHFESICTDNQDYQSAEIVGAESLGSYYEELAVKYAELAAQCKEKK